MMCATSAGSVLSAQGATPSGVASCCLETEREPGSTLTVSTSYGIHHFGCKWLKIKAVSEAAMPMGVVVEKLKHYTARVSGITDPDQPCRQHIYLDALRTVPEVEIFFGQFLAKAMWRPALNLPVGDRGIQHRAIDNNPVENAGRPIAMGKKNWLFAGSEAAGQRAAAIQSPLEAARLNGFEPMAWLTDILEKLPSWPFSRIDALLSVKKPA